MKINNLYKEVLLINKGDIVIDYDYPQKKYMVIGNGDGITFGLLDLETLEIAAGWSENINELIDLCKINRNNYEIINKDYVTFVIDNEKITVKQGLKYPDYDASKHKEKNIYTYRTEKSAIYMDQQINPMPNIYYDRIFNNYKVISSED